MNFDISNLKTNSHIHFIGIGGISMSALAEILHNMGFKVSGSDMKSSNLTQKLANMGIKIYIGHDSSNVEDADVVVYTVAVKQDNPEIVRAKELNIDIIERSTLLGEIMKKYDYSINIAGTHGKTTTTSMISLICLEANLDPTITVGGELNFIGGNLRIGNSKYFITEACEYYESFLKFHPFIGIILNIDADHLDYYKDIDHITEAFEKFAKLIPQNGYLIANIDDERVSKITNKVNCNIITFAINKNAQFYASNIEFNLQGHPSFDVYYNNNLIGRIDLNIPGIHNVYNALAAIACSMTIGISFEHCKDSLRKFCGAKRRFEKLGEFNNITVIDDYAHHPTEVKATLEAAKNYPHNRIWCIFQPHTFSRTKALLKDFSEAFDCADKIIITNIYAAREKDTGEIHSRDLVQKIKERNKDVMHIENFESIKEYIRKNAVPNDVVITMGAGDVRKIGEELVLNC